MVNFLDESLEEGFGPGVGPLEMLGFQDENTLETID